MKRLIGWFKRYGEPEQVMEVLRFDEDGEWRWHQLKWQVKPVFAWYDFWVGVYVDRDKRRVYVLPIPCVGFVFYWG